MDFNVWVYLYVSEIVLLVLTSRVFLLKMGQRGDKMAVRSAQNGGWAAVGEEVWSNGLCLPVHWGPRRQAFLTLSLCNGLTRPLGYYGFLWRKYICVWNRTSSRNGKFSPLVNLQPSVPVQCLLCYACCLCGLDETLKLGKALPV